MATNFFPFDAKDSDPLASSLFHQAPKGRTRSIGQQLAHVPPPLFTVAAAKTIAVIWRVAEGLVVYVADAGFLKSIT